MRWEANRAIERVGRVEPLVTDLTECRSDDLVRLWVEDVCWQVQMVDWARQRPPRWRRRARREWQHRQDQLEGAGRLLREHSHLLRERHGNQR